MAKITNGTRELLYKKVLEKSQDKRDALAGELQKLSDSLDAETEKMKAKAVALITEEFEKFDARVAQILKSHGLKFSKKYNYDYTVEGIITEDSGKAHIKERTPNFLEAVHNPKDLAVKRLDHLRADLAELDDKRKKACEDIELRVALGAKFDEVVELINNLQF